MIKPYIRGGYALSFFVEEEATFTSKTINGNTYYEETTGVFDFANFQHSLCLAAGFEIDLNLMAFTVEMMVEKGDGISAEKDKSGTLSYALQLGVLF
jgi:hypothetical protein